MDNNIGIGVFLRWTPSPELRKVSIFLRVSFCVHVSYTWVVVCVYAR